MPLFGLHEVLHFGQWWLWMHILNTPSLYAIDFHPFVFRIKKLNNANLVTIELILNKWKRFQSTKECDIYIPYAITKVVKS